MGSSRDALERCLQLCDTGDTVLFLDAGVMHVTGEIEPPGAGVGLYTTTLVPGFAQPAS